LLLLLLLIDDKLVFSRTIYIFSFV